MATQIRPYTPADLNVVSDLMFSLQDYFFEIDSSSKVRKFSSRDESVSYFNQSLKDVEQMDGAIYVAELDGQIVGFVQGIITSYEGEVMHSLGYKKSKDGWIGLLFTKPESRGEGVGTDLIDKMRSYFVDEKCTSMKLIVTSDNTLAIGMYEKYGFKSASLEMSLHL